MSGIKSTVQESESSGRVEGIAEREERKGLGGGGMVEEGKGGDSPQGSAVKSCNARPDTRCTARHTTVHCLPGGGMQYRCNDSNRSWSVRYGVPVLAQLLSGP